MEAWYSTIGDSCLQRESQSRRTPYNLASSRPMQQDLVEPFNRGRSGDSSSSHGLVNTEMTSLPMRSACVWACVCGRLRGEPIAAADLCIHYTTHSLHYVMLRNANSSTLDNCHGSLQHHDPYMPYILYKSTSLFSLYSV